MVVSDISSLNVISVFINETLNTPDYSAYRYQILQIMFSHLENLGFAISLETRPSCVWQAHRIKLNFWTNNRTSSEIIVQYCRRLCVLAYYKRSVLSICKTRFSTTHAINTSWLFFARWPWVQADCRNPFAKLNNFIWRKHAYSYLCLV